MGQAVTASQQQQRSTASGARRRSLQPVAIRCYHLALKVYPKPFDKMNIGFPPYFVNFTTFPKYVYGFIIPWHQ